MYIYINYFIFIIYEFLKRNNYQCIALALLKLTFIFYKVTDLASDIRNRNLLNATQFVYIFRVLFICRNPINFCPLFARSLQGPCAKTV